ncbi:MAG: arsenosugar biosynthesis radical SAM protein ArsS [Deltaproteobacteria bacterium]|nr:arsenosugar biosynthesis radical SAM protein ArsS [Deltaproteobacteria bacterium]
MQTEESFQQASLSIAGKRPGIESFEMTLKQNGLTLQRGETTTLQINVGLLCNQACKHCHLKAGPDRQEMMDAETIKAVVAYAQRGGFQTIDITGGAPELHPGLAEMMGRLSPHGRQITLRSNLTALTDGTRDHLIEFLKAHQVVIVASFPALNESQTDSQRGRNVFPLLISALKRLNAAGYGQEASGLKLDLVSNPTGAFLPPAQERTENRFRKVLHEKWGIVFNNLYNFANVPLGRFRCWLQESGNFEQYMQRLASNFNPCAVDGLMCRTLISIDWNGYLYDCDFNLARGLFLGGRKTHISEMTGSPQPGSAVAVGDHCYTCTAGSGFT